MSSTLFRPYLRDEQHARQFAQKLTESKELSIDSLEKTIIHRARGYFPSGTGEIAILTDLQHYGGMTTLVDFTHNLYAALFFACQNNKTDGYLYALNKAACAALPYGAEKIADHFGGATPNNCLIFPAQKHPRVIFQNSVLVRAKHGFINTLASDNIVEPIEIPRAMKEPILDYIEEFMNITAQTIYNDMHGYIHHQGQKLIGDLYLISADLQHESADYQQRVDTITKIMGDINDAKSITKANYQRGIGYKMLAQNPKIDQKQKRDYLNLAAEDMRQAIVWNEKSENDDPAPHEQLSLVLRQIAELDKSRK